MYAPIVPEKGLAVWGEISMLKGDPFLCDDFNMVNDSNDRHQGLDYVIKG